MSKKLIFLLFFVYSNLGYAQTLVSQFDFLTTDLKHATEGSDGISYNTNDARLASGGGVYFIHSGGSTGLDLEIPRSDFENLESVTFSFDYKRLESYATFFKMDDFKFHMDGGQIKIEYRVKDNANLIVFNTGYSITNGARILLKVTYDKATGTMDVYENNNLKATNTTTAGKALDWPSTGNAYVGLEMDGSGSTTASLYQFQIYDKASSTLPIELISFDAKHQDAKTIINWTTASEINNQYFEIQRSINNENFKTIAIINGAGNSNHLINYSYTDFYSSSSTVYYKLKQVDYDGNFEYSKIISVSKSYTNNTKIFPNPVNANESFKVNIKEGNRIIIYNSLGRIIQDLRFDNNTSVFNLNQAGLYFVVVFDAIGNSVSTEKLIVK